MQFTTQTQQAIICPQCDNVVPIDAEFCNICGKRLRPPLANTHTGMPIASYPPPDFTSQIEDAEDDDEYIDEDEDEPEQNGKSSYSVRLPALSFLNGLNYSRSHHNKLLNCAITWLRRHVRLTLHASIQLNWLGMRGPVKVLFWLPCLVRTFSLAWPVEL